MDRKILGLIVAGVLGVSVNANAALNIYSNDVEEAQDEVNAGNYEFTQVGLSGEEAMMVKGFGKSMPLGLSLQIIIPEDWKVNLNEAATDMKVDWKGKASWPYVLEQLAKDSKLQVSIDWKTRIVTVFSKEAEELMIAKKQKEIKESEAKKLALQKEAEAAAKKASEVRKQVAVEEDKLKKEQKKLAQAKEYARLEQKVVKAYNEKNPGENASISDIYKISNVKTIEKTEEAFVRKFANGKLKEFEEAYYMLQEERMLSDNIVEWATANGWRVVWDAQSDFRITNTFETKGTLLNVVDQVISLYKKSKQPMMVKFYTGNKVIQVKDFHYEQ